MNLFKKIVSSMGPILNVVNPQNQIVQNPINNQAGVNSFAILLIGVFCGFTLCIVLMNKNMITITHISESKPVDDLQTKSGKP